MKLINAPTGEKQKQLERLLLAGAVMVYVDSRKAGVKAPEKHLNNPQLALNLSYSFQIPDFKLGDDGIEATLTFPEGKFFCGLPYKAMYGITSRSIGETVVFPEDIPPEFLAAQRELAKQQETTPLPPSSPPLENVDEKGEKSEALSSGKKKRGHLRLVKG